MADYHKYFDSSQLSMKFLVEQLDDKGQLRDKQAQQDILSMYKLPNQLLHGGKVIEADRLLDNIKTFLQPDGDFLSFPEKSGWERKTSSFPLTYYWPYINGWICAAAHKAGRYDISFPSYKYLMTFWNPALGSFTWNEPYDPSKGGQGLEQSTCMFLTAHLGSCCLLFGDLEKAVSCCDVIIKALDLQPDVDNCVYLKMSSDKGEVITSGWDEDKALFFKVNKTDENQLYFQLGYPAILCRVYRATGSKKYLDSAKRILDYCGECAGISSHPMSHKVMYGAGMVARETGDVKYKQLAEKIADNILMLQCPSGQFLKDSPFLDSLDQTAEYTGWFRDLFVELDAFKKK